MKTFKDLELKQKDNFVSVQARMKFDNGYELSVVAGEGCYSEPRENNPDPNHFLAFEIAIFNDRGDFATKDILLGHDDDIKGWQTRAYINTIMMLIQGK